MSNHEKQLPEADDPSSEGVSGGTIKIEISDGDGTKWRRVKTPDGPKFELVEVKAPAKKIDNGAAII